MTGLDPLHQADDLPPGFFYYNEMNKRKKRFKRKIQDLRQTFFLPGDPSTQVILWVAFFLVWGCGGAINKERTLKIDGLTLTYRSVNRISQGIDPIPLQHPVGISRSMVQTHLLSLQYGKVGFRTRPVFTPEDTDKISRLLTKALNRARQDRYVHFEYDGAKGLTTGEVFTGNHKIHWVFTTIHGVDYSNDPLGIRKRTWKLSPQKGQYYYQMETDFGKKARENWIVADFRLPNLGQKPPQAVQTKPAARKKSAATEKHRLLQFLNHLYDKGLIDREEYEQEKRQLMNRVKN